MLPYPRHYLAKLSGPLHTLTPNKFQQSEQRHPIPMQQILPSSPQDIKAFLNVVSRRLSHLPDLVCVLFACALAHTSPHRPRTHLAELVLRYYVGFEHRFEYPRFALGLCFSVSRLLRHGHRDSLVPCYVTGPSGGGGRSGSLDFFLRTAKPDR